MEAALRAEGRDELADRVRPLAAGARPAEAFSAVRHQVAERRGASMPEMKAAVADAWQRSDSGTAFRTALAEQGLTARPGDKKGVWLVEAAGADGSPVLVGSLARLTRARAEEVGARMAEPVPAAADSLTPAPGKRAPAPAAASAVDNRRAGAPARLTITTGSKVDDDAAKIGIQFGDSVRDAFDEARERAGAARVERADTAAAEAVVDRGPARDHGDGREGRPVDAPGNGPAGVGAGSIRSDPGVDRGGQPVAPAEPAGAAGEGDLSARPGNPAPGADSGEPGEARAARGRDRVQARRESIGLAAAVETRGGRLAELTRLVASPPTVSGV